MKKQETPLLRSRDVKAETVQPARPVGRPSNKVSLTCTYNEGVVCGLWRFEPRRCARCNWNPSKRKPAEA